MSFLDSILDVGGSAWQGLTGPGVASGIARAGILAVMLREVTASINKDNQTPEQANSTTPDYGVREQVDPDTENAIPVVYGTTFIGGIVTDAQMVNDNQTMWYCLTICEKTGNLINGQPSQIFIDEIYWNQNKVTLRSDGITATSIRDEDGVVSSDIDGLVKFYAFSGGSNSPINFTGYTNNSLTAASNLFPEWTSNHTMNDLVFVLVRVDYSKEKNITGLGNIEFKIRNTMSQPGDVLFDYMTNERYGAGIKAEEIRAG